MPLDFCHPQAPHKKLKIPEWFISRLMMDRALDAVVRRVKMLDRKHDIPYLAGYSQDGKIIYIDRHMPETMKYAGREIDTDRFLILHEEVEKTLIDQLNLHVTRPEFTCRVRWKVGSLLLWDNRCTQHYAVNDYDGFARRMLRIEIDGERPLGAAMGGKAAGAARTRSEPART